VIFSAAMSGYKQPQHAMALAYLISAGAQFDVAINVDGYNEVVLPYLDNYSRGVSPLFPRGWRDRISARGVGSKLAGEIIYLDGRRQELAEALERGGIYRSAVAGFVALRQLDDITSRLAALARADLDAIGFEQSGPYATGQTREQVLAE